MEFAASVLAIPGVLELCLRYGKFMEEKYKTFAIANDLFRVQVLALESRWLQIEAQIKFLNTVWNRLPPRLQIHFNHVLSWLHNILLKATTLAENLLQTKSVQSTSKSTAASIISAISKEGVLRRGAFVLTQKEALDGLIGELRTWHQDMLGPSWFQLLRIPGAVLLEEPASPSEPAQVQQLRMLHKKVNFVNDQKVREEVVLSDDSIGSHRSPFFGANVSACAQNKLETIVLVEDITLPSYVDQRGTVNNFCQLASKLNTVVPASMNLPRCWGIVDQTKANSAPYDLSLVFYVPVAAVSTRSLREVLMEHDDHFPLAARFSIALQLAKGVIAIHNLRIVHKNIRPESILLFDGEEGVSDTPPVNKETLTGKQIQAYIFGFEQFRPLGERSHLRSDIEWRKLLYRHPSRHGAHVETEYSMQHDIFSLGVCLLELGFWKSFILDPSGRAVAHPDFDINKVPGKEQYRKALVIKERLQRLAREELPAKMGQLYSDVVVSCLGCLDQGNIEFGEQELLEDVDEIVVSVRFMEKIILQLQSIVV